jgi:hypothetical protein
MPRTIRFHLDEHVPHAVARGLRRLGIDVRTTTDAERGATALGECLLLSLHARGDERLSRSRRRRRPHITPRAGTSGNKDRRPRRALQSFRGRADERFQSDPAKIHQGHQ